jgi:tryprostatin B 6-hydroxylase
MVALRNYEPRIIKYGEQLDQYLASTSGEVVHSNDWFHFYAFDVMGDLAFGKSFNMLLDEGWHYSIAMLREFMSMQGPVSPVPWLVRLGFGLPGLANGWKRWVEFCRHLMTERILVTVHCLTRCS